MRLFLNLALLIVFIFAGLVFISKPALAFWQPPNLGASISCPTTPVTAGQSFTIGTSVWADADHDWNHATMTKLTGTWGADELFLSGFQNNPPLNAYPLGVNGFGQDSNNPPDSFWSYTINTQGTYIATIRANWCGYMDRIADPGGAPHCSAYASLSEMGDIALQEEFSLTDWNYKTCSFTVNPAQGPTLDSLQVTNAGNTGFAGVSGVSGRQAGVDNGSDWFNPINVTVIASQGSSAIKEYYVKFTPGFEVAYTTTPGSIGGNCTGQWCYNSGGWNNLISQGFSSGGVAVYPNGANSWKAKYAPAFGSNNISTSAYVKDVNNLCSGGSCTYAVLSGKTCSGNICTIP